MATDLQNGQRPAGYYPSNYNVGSFERESERRLGAAIHGIYGRAPDAVITLSIVDTSFGTAVSYDRQDGHMVVHEAVTAIGASPALAAERCIEQMDRKEAGK